MSKGGLFCFINSLRVIRGGLETRNFWESAYKWASWITRSRSFLRTEPGPPRMDGCLRPLADSLPFLAKPTQDVGSESILGTGQPLRPGAPWLGASAFDAGRSLTTEFFIMALTVKPSETRAWGWCPGSGCCASSLVLFGSLSGHLFKLRVSFSATIFLENVLFS